MQVLFAAYRMHSQDTQGCCDGYRLTINIEEGSGAIPTSVGYRTQEIGWDLSAAPEWWPHLVKDFAGHFTFVGGDQGPDRDSGTFLGAAQRRCCLSDDLGRNMLKHLLTVSNCASPYVGSDHGQPF